MQTSAGHGADPSTTKRDLYAALLNPENVTKMCLAVKAQKFPEIFQSACFLLLGFQLLLKGVLTTSKKYCDYFNPYTVKFIFT